MDAPTFTLELCCKGNAVPVAIRKGLGLGAVPWIVLELLEEIGERFVGSMPDFLSEHDQHSFWVITEPMAKASRRIELDANGGCGPSCHRDHRDP